MPRNKERQLLGSARGRRSDYNWRNVDVRIVLLIEPDTRELDFDDNSLAENTRGAYPIDFIPHASAENMGPVPRNIVMLTADAFGVLPPIARLTPDQAM
jgi:ATP-dependent phosphoenolpyruvate carboxykinase